MKILKKKPVAILLTIIMIVSAVFLGIRKGDTSVAPENVGLDKDLFYSWTEDFLLDEPGVLTSSQIRDICIYNSNWADRYDSIIAVAILEYVDGDIGDTAYDMGAEIELGEADAILVVDAETGNSFLAVGPKYPMNNDEIAYHMDHYLYEDAMDGRYGQGILTLFSGINEFYVENYGLGFEDSLLTMNSGSAIINMAVVLAMLLVILTLVDNIRYNDYRRRYYGMANPTVVFRPVLFWHGPTSNWYWRRWRQPPPARHPYYASTNRSSRSSGSSFSGFNGPTNRGSNRGGGFSSGARGSGFSSSRGGGFSSGSRGSGFSSSSRGGGFSRSSSRGGGFSHRSSGSRGGGFKRR